METRGVNIFLVYGGWCDAQGHNAIIVEMPKGRVPWSKKIAPAIHRLVKPWIKENKWYPGWNVDGFSTEEDAQRAWDNSTFPRYRWTGTELVFVPS